MLLKPLGHLSRFCFFAGININIQQVAKGTGTTAGSQYFAVIPVHMSSPRKRRGPTYRDDEMEGTVVTLDLHFGHFGVVEGLQLQFARQALAGDFEFVGTGFQVLGIDTGFVAYVAEADVGLQRITPAGA